MVKSRLLLGTACGVYFVLGASAYAQTTQTSTKIEEISKSSGGGSGSLAAAMKKVIPLKSTYAASHISKAEISKAGPAASMETLLNTAPSIHATSAGPLGVEQTVTFRSFNDAQFSQTYDGISLNSVLDGGVTNDASAKNNVLLVPLDIESIDVYRGINNPSNNSYNSLAGTVNYEPLSPSDKRGGSITGMAGSFDTRGYNAIFNTGKIGGFSDVVAFSHASSNGWLNYSKDKNDNLFTHFVQDTGQSGKLYGIFIYNHNTGEEAYDVPQSLVEKNGYNYQYPLSEYNEPLADTNFMTILGTTQELGDYTIIDLKGFFGTDDFDRNAYSNPDAQKTGFYIPNKDISHQSTTYYGLYAQQIGLQPSVTFTLPYNTIKAGGNLTSAHMKSSEYIGNTSPVDIQPGVNNLWDEHDLRTEYSAYIQDEIDLLNNKIKLTPGVKYLYANTKDHDDVGYDYPTGGQISGQSHFTSPTFGASYEFLKNTVLYGAVGQNIEFPTISGFYSNIDGKNGQGQYENNVEPVHLEPEHVTDYEAGLRYANPHYGFHSALGFYLENFTDTFITTTDPTTNLQTTTNGGSARYKGIELQLAEDFGDFHVQGQNIGNFSAYMNYSYNQAYYTSAFKIASVGFSNGQTNANVASGQALALVPRNNVNFGGAWGMQGWQATADANYVGSQFINQQDAGTVSAIQEPAYFVLNMSLSKTIQIPSRIMKSIKFAFFANNLLDRRYDSYAYSDNYTKYAGALSGQNYASVQEAAPRAFYGSVTVNF